MNKKLFWLVVIVVFIAIGYYFFGGKRAGQYFGIEGVSPSPSTAAGTASNPVAKKAGSTTPVSSKSYTELVMEYEGRRIQFDDRCQVVPKDPTFKNGTSIMLDNRSSIARTVVVGGVKYDLVAYGYRVITLSSSSLPKELAISCGSSGNVGKILLQAQILQ